MTVKFFRPLAAVLALLLPAAAAHATETTKLRLDYAYYNPVSLILKREKYLEQALPGVTVEWTLSQGSNKALEFLNAGSIDLGSTAGSAALLARANGNPIKAIYIYSQPEWTALVVPEGSPLKTLADLKGKKIAVTRGTDPHIFLLRALDSVGLGERDVRIVPLQHPEGRLALQRGDVDAWSGLDPFMAQAELESKARLLFRDASLNTYGFLNVREAFAKQNPETVERLLRAYEQARRQALADPKATARVLAEASKLSEDVAAKQIERTNLTNPVIGDEHLKAIVAAGAVLKKSGVVPEDTDVEKVAAELIDRHFAVRLAAQ